MLFPQVQSLPVGDQAAEDLLSCASVSELLLQPAAWAKLRREPEKLDHPHHSSHP